MPVRIQEDRMSLNQHFNRVDLVDAKIQITKKIGAHKAEKYFNLLSRFFSKKLSKSEFNKLCIVAVGRENLGLHNWLIRSIVTNACLSTTAPPPKASNQSKPINGKAANGYQMSCLQSLYRDSLPQSPRRVRTHKYGDRPSPLGPHGNPHPKVLEQQSATELHSLRGTPIKVICVEDGEEVVQSEGSLGVNIRKQLTAPFGVQIRAKPTRKVLSLMESCYSKGELPDTVSLRKRLEQKLEAEGLKVSPEYANVVNLSLDMYLKRRITRLLEFANSAAGRNTMPSMNGMQPVRFVQAPTSYTYASSVDLSAAMEFDAPLLGEDWQMQLETTALQQEWQVGAGSSLWDGGIGGGCFASDSLLQNSSGQVYK